MAASTSIMDEKSRALPLSMETEPALLERLQTFGLIEPDEQGGWQLTECCEAALAVLSEQPDTRPKAQARASTVLPWVPRRL